MTAKKEREALTRRILRQARDLRKRCVNAGSRDPCNREFGQREAQAGAKGPQVVTIGNLLDFQVVL